jgi:hypothetical protein
VKSRAGVSLAAGVAALGLGGCGGGAPLLHPAHTLPNGKVAFAAGTSGRLLLGGLRDAERELEAAGAESGGASTPAERARFASGAIARFAVGPGVAPFVAGRVGLGNHNEAGLAYTGRGVRLDGRHAWERESVALSVGLAGLGTLARPGDRPPNHVNDAPGGDTSLRRVKLTSASDYGLELPVLFGYRSSADVVKAWAGLRAGLARDSFELTLVESPDEPWGSDGHALRWWSGGLVGFSVGLAPIEVRVELNAAFESARGKLVTKEGELTGEAAGWSLTPTMAISAKF